MFNEMYEDRDKSHFENEIHRFNTFGIGCYDVVFRADYSLKIAHYTCIMCRYHLNWKLFEYVLSDFLITNGCF